MIINPYLVQPSIPAFTGLLDTYSGAAVAYSAARRLSSTYTGSLIRVRRSSDNTEQDIGYTAGNVLDESALTTFVGANNGFVTTWYDQSGNGTNATQSTAANQPRIVSSGIVEKINTKPALSLDGINDSFGITQFTVGTNHANYLVGKRTASLKLLCSFSNTAASYEFLSGLSNDNKYYLFYSTTNFIQSTSTYTTSNQQIISGYKGTNKEIYNNDTLITTSDAGLSFGMKINSIGNYQNSIFTTGHLQETIFWLSDQSSNRTGITTNINTFYSIY